MHILFVGFVWPEPSSSAAGQNILSYMRTCLTMPSKVSFCSAAQQTERTHDLASMGIETFNVELNCSSFNQKLNAIQPDIVIFDRFLSFEQFAWRVKEACPKAMLVLDAEDLHFLRAARHTLLKQNSKTNLQSRFMQSDDILQSDKLSMLYNDVTLRELACIYQADLTLVLSKFEHQLLSKHFNVPENQVRHLSFILPEKGLFNNLRNISFQQKTDFVFIGNFRHAPNYHAVKVLREQCWPAIQENLKVHYPNITCHVFGAYMSPKAKQLESKKLGFVMHGYADNQYNEINSARVMLAPITFGAGVKGKLLDAMLCSTPFVTTPIGYEGISQKPCPGELVTTIDDFIEAAIGLYTKQDKWENANEYGDLLLENDYKVERNCSNLLACLRDKHNVFEQERLTNFSQRLLSHHQFQTSKYMSQWIEAKNK